jgi:DNA-binding CsgD family transcriptional regulator
MIRRPKQMRYLDDEGRSMANRDDRWGRLRGLVATWLRAPLTWRGLLLVAMLAGAFSWGVVVLGIALTMAERGAEQWWLVLVFGGAVLAVALASVYLVFGRVLRGAGPDTTGSGRAAAPPPAGTTPASASTTPTPPILGDGLEPLSERELEVLQLLATGRSNREIAAELYVATGTVKAHLNNIFRKLEARTRLQAVTRARELRLLTERHPK